jgi:hypothetical protein
MINAWQWHVGALPISSEVPAFENLFYLFTKLPAQVGTVILVTR